MQEHIEHMLSLMKEKTFRKLLAVYRVLPPSTVDSRPTRKSAKKTTLTSGRNKHCLPKVWELLKENSHWFELTKRSDYEYPGFKQGDKIAHCKDIKKSKEFGSCKRVHCMWNDCQLTKRYMSTQAIDTVIEGQKTKVNIRRAYCEGVKKCAFDRCSYTVSNRQRLNKCKDRDSHPLVSTGNCPVQLLYVLPAEDDGRRWVSCLPGEPNNHYQTLRLYALNNF